LPNPPLIDLRSDTVTRPTAEMKAAMMQAPLGDDVFGDDPTVLALQERAAALLEKEAGLFVPSGTMSNQLALRAHCRSGDEIIAHRGSHIFNYESGAAASLAGVQLRLLDSQDGTLPIDAVEASIHQTDDPHFAPTTLICFENTNNSCGGTVLPAENVSAVTALAAARGIRCHLDGARLFNAATASDRPAAELARPFDTISICLSKGLGSPVGSVLVGDKAAIARAYRYRKMYGGGMRQAGIIAAAGLYALDHHIDRLADDHRRAQTLAKALAAFPGLHVDLERVHTNLVYFELDSSHPLAGSDAEGPRLGTQLAKAGVRVTGGPSRYRAVLHLDVDDAALGLALERIQSLLLGI